MGIQALSSSQKMLLSIDDLSDAEVLAIMRDAENVVNGRVGQIEINRFSAALLFLTPSLRTRVGFATATIRLGGTPIPVDSLRIGKEMSASESLGDTLRVLSGMVEIIVMRTPDRLDRKLVREMARCPVVNGGDGLGDHPVQSLIDLFAIRRHAPPIETLHIGVCGDLRTRSSRSLLHLLTRFRPGKLRLIAPQGRETHGVDLGSLGSRVEVVHKADFTGINVLYMAGLPAGSGDEQMSAEARSHYALGVDSLEHLPRKSVILSPLPVIDEVDEFVRRDPRFVGYRQSDEGVSVRMAVLKKLLAQELT
jgi:aspartate carbamoyltransferase catalytic subunit